MFPLSANVLELLVESRRRTVLITGAAGNLGGKAHQHFAQLPDLELRLLDRDPRGDPAIAEADFAAPLADWSHHFVGVHTLVHFAAHPSSTIDWDTAQRLNVDLTCNVFAAAAARGVKRIVFASSNWVMAGYRFAGLRLTTDLPPAPINAYGNSKLFGERLGISLAQSHGIRFVALRIGLIRPGENIPGPHLAMGLWGQQMWLSNRDFCNGIERAVLADLDRPVIANLMSDNPGMPWDIEHTRMALGYVPADNYTASITEAQTKGAEVFERTYALQDAMSALWDTHAF